MKWWKSLSADRFRAVCLALWLLPFAAGAVSAQTLDRAVVQVEIDASSPVAAQVRRFLPSALQRELRAKGVQGYPGGSRLIVIVREIYLSQDGGLPFGGSFSRMTMPDSIGGAMRVVDARGRVLFERPLLVASPPDSGGPGFSPYNEARRVNAMIGAMAYWAVRYAQR